ncbi:hypothetical protein JTB14_005389 [Gonioctena quinquepunctata]|nr:hypothetical protein JTB14_005389 [Gonioctena quinquepunctata]
MESNEESSEELEYQYQYEYPSSRSPGTSDEDWELEKYGRFIRELAYHRTDKTEEENDEFFTEKFTKLYELVEYIRNIIQGKQEIFDKNEEMIYNERFAEYTAVCAIYEKISPDLWGKYIKNRKILRKNYMKKPKQTNIMTEEGTEKGGEAGSVPRTYSMGAQPPPSNLPLNKEYINVKGNKVRSPEICQIDGPMDVTNETIESPNSSEDESSGRPTKNNENSKKKTLKRKKISHAIPKPSA